MNELPTSGARLRSARQWLGKLECYTQASNCSNCSEEEFHNQSQSRFRQRPSDKTNPLAIEDDTLMMASTGVLRKMSSEKCAGVHGHPQRDIHRDAETHTSTHGPTYIHIHKDIYKHIHRHTQG